MLDVTGAWLGYVERKRMLLGSLVDSGRVPVGAHDQLDRRFAGISEKLEELKKTLEHEEDFWRTNREGAARGLERALASSEFRFIDGEIDSKELEYARTILISGLDSMKEAKHSSTEDYPELGFPDALSHERTEETELKAVTETDSAGISDVRKVPEDIGMPEQPEELLTSVKAIEKSRLERRTRKRPVRKKRTTEQGSTPVKHHRVARDKSAERTDKGYPLRRTDLDCFHCRHLSKLRNDPRPFCIQLQSILFDNVLSQACESFERCAKT